MTGMKNHLLTALIGVSAGLSGAYIFNIIDDDKNIYLTQQVTPSTHQAKMSVENIVSLNENFIAASDASTRSVVYIKTTTGNQYDQMNWFDFYFNGRGGQSISSGSGVIFSKDGYVITNHHVIENATKIEVVHEKKTYEAKVIGRDPSTDLAVLKVESADLPAVKIGNSRELKVGEWVLAVGNPFNLNSTVTAGIVSAKARSINVVNSQFPIESFIQTDAAINPGNSGGALVNLKGELVGINTAILSRTGSYAGYGFAVPADIVVKIVNDIIKFGEVQKAFFGADISEINTDVAKKFELKDFNGVVLTSVQEDGAAKKAGLQRGDVILKINNLPIDSKSNFDEIISCFSPGDKVTVIFKRSGTAKEAGLTLTNREGTTEQLKREIYTSKSLGADFEKISKVEKDKLGLENGVRIVNVQNGLIARLGIEEGFIITGINGNKVKSPEEIASMLESARGRIVIEGINSGGSRGYYSYYF
jgi:serine protease Do